MKLVIALALLALNSNLASAETWKIECTAENLTVNSVLNLINPAPQYGSPYEGLVTVTIGTQATQYKAEMGAEMSSGFIFGFDTTGAIVVQINLPDASTSWSVTYPAKLLVKLPLDGGEWTGGMLCQSSQTLP